MFINLPTKFLGGSSAAILLSGGSDTRIYYQAPDGAIHEAAGRGPAIHQPRYTDRVVVNAADVRINSPIAAITWTDANEVEQIRLYVFDRSNFLCEHVGTSNTSRSFWAGRLTARKYEAAANSGILYAVTTFGVGIPGIRVGYQPANNPGQISEANAADNWSEGSFM